MAIPQVQLDPIYSLPYLYISGLNISVPVVSGGTSTLLAIAPGACRDSSNNIDMEVGFANLQGNVNAAPIIINTAVVGANGIDAGALAASQLYSVYLIADSRGYLPVAGIVSLSSNAMPLLPLGYDSLRLLGFVGTSAGSVFTTASVLNAVNAKTFYLSPPTSVLAGGNATTFTAIDMTPPLPASPAMGIVLLTVNYTPAAVGNNVQFRYAGSADTSGLVTVSGLAAAVPQQNQVQVVYVASATANVEYKVSSASDAVTVLVSGWTIDTVSVA